LGEGRGFEIIQGRLGPGRIHHWYHTPRDIAKNSMRCIGVCERAMASVLARASDPSRQPFGKSLKDHDLFLAQIAELRLEIEAARLLVLNAADMIDRAGAKGAMKQIAMAKVPPRKRNCLLLDYCSTGYWTSVGQSYSSIWSRRHVPGSITCRSLCPIKDITYC